MANGANGGNGAMSEKFAPIVAPDAITINLNRGLKGLADGLAERLPGGRQAMNGGLRAVIHRAIDQNPQTPDRDFTAVDLAEHLGVIQKPRRRKR